MNNYKTRFYLTSFFKVTNIDSTGYTLQDQQSPANNSYTVKQVTSTTPGVKVDLNKIYYMGLTEFTKNKDGEDISEAIVISSGPVTVLDTDTCIVKGQIDYVPKYSVA